MSRDMNVTGPTLASPVWCGDFLSRDHLIPGPAKLNAVEFFPLNSVLVTTSGVAAVGAVAIPVNALSGPIPSGTVLDFTGAGEFARLTAAAAAGATSLTVEALDAQIEAADTARYAGTGRTRVPGGTVVGRTIAERDAGTGYGPALETDDEIYVIAFDVDDASHIADVELVRHNVQLKENFLPGWAGLSTAVKTAVRARYRCMRGAE